MSYNDFFVSQLLFLILLHLLLMNLDSETQLEGNNLT